jgi:hypothetical protein
MKKKQSVDRFSRLRREIEVRPTEISRRLIPDGAKAGTFVPTYSTGETPNPLREAIEAFRKEGK